MLKDFLKWVKSESRAVQGITLALILLSLFFFFLLTAFLTGTMIKSISEISGKEIHSLFYYALDTKFGKGLTFGLFFGFLGFGLCLSLGKKERNTVFATDDRGVSYLSKGTFGSGRWMEEREIPKSFFVGNIADTDTTIYGQLGEGGTKVVGYQKNEKGGSGNRNVLILASMGSGKSFCYVRTELIQAALRGNSFVVTDPSGELYGDLALLFKEKGMDVRVLNLSDPAFSECWNCLSETIDPDTGRLSPTRLNEFAAIYMQNSGDTRHDFWYDSALNLLKTMISFTAYMHDLPIVEALCALYRKVGGMGALETDEGIIQMKTLYLGFPKMKELILLKDGGKTKDLSDTIDRIICFGSDVPYTIGSLYDYLLDFGRTDLRIQEILSLAERAPDSLDGRGTITHPLYAAYKTFGSNDSGEVKKSAIQNLQLRFQLLSDSELKNVLSEDGICLSSMNRTPTACFVILSDKSTATKPISSLFFSFLFKDAQEGWDREMAKTMGTERTFPCIPLVAMLDEFYSIGVIGGSAESFGVTMSNSRKRCIYLSIIVQAYSQLEALYGKNIADIIQGGCGTLLYLGGNDPSTCSFISSFASGEATVLSESHREREGIFGVDPYQNEVNVSQGKRSLLTEDEARRWKNKVLLVKQGEYPVKLDPFPWTSHPMAVFARPSSVYKNLLPTASQRKEREKELEEILKGKAGPSYAHFLIESLPVLETEKPEDPESPKALESFAQICAKETDSWPAERKSRKAAKGMASEFLKELMNTKRKES